MTASPLPSTGAVTGLKETLDFFSDPAFASRRFGLYGDVFETSLLGQRIVFIRGEQAIRDLLGAIAYGWPDPHEELAMDARIQRQQQQP